MEIVFGTGLSQAIDEIYAQTKKTVSYAGETVRETQSLSLQAEKLGEHFRSRRTSVVNMVNTCREKLISVNNILEFGQERKEYWTGVKERTEKFLVEAEKYLPIIDKICAILSKECERLNELKASSARKTEEFISIAEVGVKGLLKVKDAVDCYARIPSLGEVK